jgi:hypothetical protein
MSRLTARDNLAAGTWMSLSVEGMNIDKYYSTSLEVETDSSSYLVVYEDSEIESYTPVKTIIDEDVLYFQAATTHLANIESSAQYAIYYRTPNLRYLKAIQNGPTIEDDPFEFQVTTPQLSDFAASLNEVRNLTYEVGLNSDSTFNFSFVNGEVDWNNGETSFPGAKVYLSFSGPAMRLYGTKGPGYGKVKVKLTGLASESLPSSQVEIDNLIIDCYSASIKNDALLFATDDLNYRDYVMEMSVVSDKNPLSSGNFFKVSSYKFNYNLYLDIGSEEISTDAVLAPQGLVRATSLGGTTPGGTTTIVNNNNAGIDGGTF